MGSTSVTPFTGSSAFAAQLQQVISTAIVRASAPLAQLQTEQSTLQGQQSELGTLSNNFSSLQTAIASLSAAAQNNGLSAQVSDSTVATASVGTGALPGIYSLTVVSLGTQANTISADSLPTVTDPTTSSIDSSSSYTLSVEGQSYTLTPSTNSLDALVQAINSSGASVQATVVNVGTSSAPDYRLSIQSSNYAPADIQLSDGTNDLLDTVTPGTYVQYQVNGQPATPVNATSRQATISPGLTVSLAGTGTANITVAASTGAVSNALNTFVSAYNSAVAELQKNRGKSGGALSGQSIIYELQNQLNSIANYNSGGNGSVNSLADVGLAFDSNGNLTFDASALSADNPQDVLNFLGGTSTGGFLQVANNILNSVTDSTTGMLPDATQTMTSQLSQIGTQISNQEASIGKLQQTLTTQMASADAAISSLEQQVTEITDLFTSMQQNARSISG
jgi:flagellar hook-associated protein 2